MYFFFVLLLLCWEYYKSPPRPPPQLVRRGGGGELSSSTWGREEEQFFSEEKRREARKCNTCGRVGGGHLDNDGERGGESWGRRIFISLFFPSFNAHLVCSSEWEGTHIKMPEEVRNGVCVVAVVFSRFSPQFVPSGTIFLNPFLATLLFPYLAD